VTGVDTGIGVTWGGGCKGGNAPAIYFMPKNSFLADKLKTGK
jgi:hypothetical protein